MKLKLLIPDSQNEIKLESFQRFAQIEEPTDQDVLSCFYGIDKEASFEMKAKDVKQLVDAINKLLETNPEDLITHFTLDGVKFGFIPNLDDISYGENNDIISYINDAKQWHKAMAVLFRPVTKEQFGKYLIEDYEGSGKYSEVMKKAPLDAFLSTQVFFYNLLNDFMNCIPAFIREESRQHSAESGEIIRQYTDLLEVELNKLKRSLNSHYINV